MVQPHVLPPFRKPDTPVHIDAQRAKATTLGLLMAGAAADLQRNLSERQRSPETPWQCMRCLLMLHGNSIMHAL